ncbi:MAG: SRPBCC family protein [Acidobacteria bacterium]|nr:SRPBCC family protein [Acidobacteriota bacterium]
MQPGGCRMSTDRIEKKIFLRAPRKRVWHALADSAEFGTWFGMKFDGPFTPGACMRGVIVPTTVDPEVAKAQKEYEGIPFEITIEQMEPERLFSFRWHPFAVERGVDYSVEPTTLVVFALEEVAEGVMLTVTESGFDRIPLARRAKAFTANEQGWGMVVKLIEGYLVHAP